MARFSGDFPKNYDVFQASGGYQQEPEIQAWRAFPWVSLRKVHKNMVASISLGTFAIKLCTFRLSAGHRRSFIHSLASAKRSASPGGCRRHRPGISVLASAGLGTLPQGFSHHRHGVKPWTPGGRGRGVKNAPPHQKERSQLQFFARAGTMGSITYSNVRK